VLENLAIDCMFSEVLVDGMQLYCVDVGADVLDQTGQNTEMFGHLAAEEVSFELSQKQNDYFNVMRRINSYLREEYHTLHEFLWRTGFTASASSSWPKWLVTSPRGLRQQETWFMIQFVELCLMKSILRCSF